VDDRTRPVVVAVDFDQMSMRVSGNETVPVENLRVDGSGTLTFETSLGGDTLRFSGRPAGTQLSGRVTVGAGQMPFSLTRLPDLAAPRDRVEAWRQDLDVVRMRFLRYDRSFMNETQAAARHRLGRLSGSLGQRTDQEILVDLSRTIGLSGNAHTRLYFVRNRTEVRRLPIRAWWFRDELRVVRAAVDQNDLLGCEIRRIGDVSTDEAFERVRDLKAGNTSWQRYMSAYYLTSSDVLAGAGVVRNADEVEYTLDCGGTSLTTTLEALPLRQTASATEAWWDLVPAHPAVDSSLMPALPPRMSPRFLRRAQENYWFEYVPDIDSVYVQYNRSQESGAEPISAFAERLATVLSGRSVRALIVDVRFNTGGDLSIGTVLVERIAPFLRGTPVFVLTGRATFSAGITHAAQWKDTTGATVVGEPAGDSLDFWSEGGNLVLPNSGLTVHYANAFHRYSTKDYPDRRPFYFELSVGSLEPDITIEPAWADYIAGRDPVLAAVTERIQR